MARLQVPRDTVARQREASDPHSSAWVRANAGAGKTYVLAERVLRLLLAGADPARILCITYTKAAAAEMANRVFAWLGEWATMPEPDLAARLAALQGRAPQPRELLRARRLFAAAIETPGRLRIQTIHAFCERVLQQFPFEASVTAGFSVIDERASSELLAEARGAVLRRAAAEPDGLLGRSLERLVTLAGDDALDRIVREVLMARGAFEDWTRPDGLEDGLDELARRLGLGEGEDETSIVREILDGPHLPPSEWPSIAALLAEGSATDRDRADALRIAAASDDPDAALERYCSLFLTNAGEVRKKAVVTKAISGPHPALAERLEAEKARVAELCDRLRAARILAASSALFRIAEGVIAGYERLKAARGLLDYDDLIARTEALLTRADAAWVLFKLDGGLDHVLVDEAQDTSPRQWRVVRAIVEEFFAGASAREDCRTLFVVGDAKQSIYSFQGADPARFGAMRRHFSARARDAGTPLSDVELTLSFRSTPTVLSAVDGVFATPRAAAGLHPLGESEAVVHQAIREREPGRIELWPLERTEPRAETPPWDAPFDVERPGSADARLARRIAQTVAGWLDRGERLEATGRPIRAGDVMILVRNRAPFAEPMIRALKEAGVPVAGADRMVLTEHIAVMDLMALGRFTLMPEDDLNLAALLKSPLVGLGEDDLLVLAPTRHGSLWDALARAGAEGGGFATAHARLAEWRRRPGFERPYEFFSRVLGADGGRRAFHGRLGHEASEALDEFLAAALAHERVDTPTMAGFLAWLDASAADVKRDMEQGRDEVRVMTVHGAKGLEAPIVFLPDTCRAPIGRGVGPIFRFGAEDEGGPLAWAPRKGDDCPATRALRGAAEARRREEENRLLYVAMTRARDRLYIAGYEGGRTRPDGCWYDLVDDALSPLLAGETHAEGRIVRLLAGDTPAAPAADAEPAAPGPAALPRWAHEPRAAETAEARRSPSHLADHTPARTGPPPDPAMRRRARERGTVMHRLLESLPGIEPAYRAEAGMRALGVAAPGWSGAECEAALREILAVLDEPAFAPAFAPGGRSEVSVAGRIEGIDGIVVGQIDRLADDGEQVLVVDYKTDRAPPVSVADVPQAYIAQMAAYRVLVARLYPGRSVRCALLWTAGPALMDITQAATLAHGRAALLDGPANGS